MHLLELLVLGWFWATPILYQYERAAEWLDANGIPGWLQLLNPATPIVITFQRALYGREQRRRPPAAPRQRAAVVPRRARRRPRPRGRSSATSPCACSTAPTSTSPRRCDGDRPVAQRAIVSSTACRSRSASPPIRSTRSRSGSSASRRGGHVEFQALRDDRLRDRRRARPSASSATTAPASRRCSSASPASSRRPRGRCACAAGWRRCSSSAPVSTPS